MCEGTRIQTAKKYQLILNFFSILIKDGLAEWSNATDSRSVPFGGAGSNPAGHISRKVYSNNLSIFLFVQTFTMLVLMKSIILYYYFAAWSPLVHLELCHSVNLLTVKIVVINNHTPKKTRNLTIKLNDNVFKIIFSHSIAKLLLPTITFFVDI